MPAQHSGFTHWLPLAALLALLVAMQMLHAQTDLAWNRSEIAHGAYWKILSGHFVHNNINHLAMNFAGAVLVFLLISEMVSGWAFIAHTAIIALLSGLLLYGFEVNLTYYVGFSAVLHGLVAAYAVHKFQRDRWIACLVLIALGLKLAFEGQSVTTASLIGIRVASEAHFWGAISGIVSGAIAVSIMSLRRAP